MLIQLSEKLRKWLVKIDLCSLISLKLKPIPIIFSSISKNITLIILMTLCVSLPASALKQNFQSWQMVKLSGKFKHKFHYMFANETRFIDTGNYLYRMMLMTGLGYSLSKNMIFWLGYSFIPTERATTGMRRDEQRTFQQLTWKIINNKDVTIMLRARLEQRHFMKLSGTSWRFRQKVQVNLTGLKWGHITPVLSDEVFFNLNHPSWSGSYTFNQNRIFAGVLFPVTRHVMMLVGYMNMLMNSSRATMSHVLYWQMSIKPG